MTASMRSDSAHGSDPTRGDMLVVDDDAKSAKLLVNYLEGAGHRVRLAHGGPEAIAAARLRSPDIVFLDVMMPGMTGFEVCRVLKADPGTRLSQVMMVTALSGSQDRVTGLDTGADDYVTKPVRQDEFLAKARALLRIRRLLLELEQARADLTDLHELRKTLAQTLVHDLKNPLTAVVANLELLSRDCTFGASAALSRCRDATGRMVQMILGLLDVEALEEGHLRPQPQAVVMAELLELVGREAQDRARDLEIRFDLDPTCVANADPILIRRVLDNLLANALEHSPDTGRIEVHLRAQPEGIQLSVHDQGDGVPVAHREEIFEKYAQFRLHRQGFTHNRGLGLTFCRLAVEAQGGTIWVDDSSLGGAAFHVLLPEAAELAEPVAP